MGWYTEGKKVGLGLQIQYNNRNFDTWIADGTHSMHEGYLKDQIVNFFSNANELLKIVENKRSQADYDLLWESIRKNILKTID